MGFIKFGNNKINLPQPKEGEDLELFIGINLEINSTSLSFKGGFIKPKDGKTKAKVKKENNKKVAEDMTIEKAGTKVF